jgi:hypothetical protein
MHRFKLLVVTKVMCIALCLIVMFGGNHPPSHAQVPTFVQQTVSNEDIGQDHDIAALNKHLETTDALAETQRVTLEVLGNDVAEIKGEERIFGGLITILCGGGLVIQLRRKDSDTRK